MPAKTRVLIIDDEENLTQLLKMNLETMGNFEMLACNSPKEGLAFARTQKPDVVILDLMMPEMDGTEVAARLMENPATQDIPIVFLTALADRGQMEKSGGNVAGREMLAKPVSMAEIIKKIELVTGKKA